MWQNSKTQNLTTQKLKIWLKKTQKLQIWQDSECDNTQNATKLKTKNLKTQKTKNVTKHITQNVTKFKNLKCAKLKHSKCGKTQNVREKTQKLKVWQNSKNKNVSKNLNWTKI